MKLRNIRNIDKIEYVIVPLMMSAVNAAGELSAAAATRGIDNPGKKTSAIDIRLRKRDYLFLVLFSCFSIFALFFQG
jgi:energy-coupling factor transport system permease protein